MGNGSTVDAFCGRDPDFTVIHDEDEPDKHFDGCGFTQEKCTTKACWDDIANAITDGTPLTMTEIREWFQDNMKAKGQCCEWEEGWTGFGCDVPVCNPKCQQGDCIDKDVCQCYTGWQGTLCDSAICTDWQQGNCIAPEVCDCFYGYVEENWSRFIHTIGCEHGTVTGVDECTWDPGWDGEIWDTPICSTPWVDGWWKAPDYWEKRVNVERPVLSNWLVQENGVWTKWAHGYYYDSGNKLCRLCSITYDSFCIDWDSTKCLDCSWPR